MGERRGRREKGLWRLLSKVWRKQSREANRRAANWTRFALILFSHFAKQSLSIGTYTGVKICDTAGHQLSWGREAVLAEQAFPEVDEGGGEENTAERESPQKVPGEARFKLTLLVNCAQRDVLNVLRWLDLV